jgi:hypothetical protein
MAVAGEGIERDVAEHAEAGNSFLMARTDWQTKLSGFSASEPCSSRSEGSV